MRQGAEISVGSLKRLFVLSHISAYAPVWLFKEKPILARPVARQNNCISARIGGRARQSAGNARKRESGDAWDWRSWLAYFFPSPRVRRFRNASRADFRYFTSLPTFMNGM